MPWSSGNHKGGQPGFRAFRPDPILNSLARNKPLNEAEEKQYETRIKGIHDKAASLWNGWLKRLGRGTIDGDTQMQVGREPSKLSEPEPKALAEEHLELSKSLGELAESLSDIEGELRDYGSGARKGRLTGMVKTTKNLLRDVAGHLIFSTPEGYANRGDSLTAPAELKEWIRIMYCHNMASLYTLQLLVRQSGEEILDQARDLAQEGVRFASRRHTFLEGMLTIRLDLKAAARRIDSVPLSPPERAEMMQMLERLRGESKSVKKSVNKKTNKVNAAFERLTAHIRAVTEGNRRSRVIVTLTVLIASGAEMILNIGNIIKVQALEVAGAAGFVIGLGLLGFDAVQEGSDIKKAVREGKLTSQAEDRIEDSIDKIEENTFVERARPRRRHWWSFH